MLFSCVDTLEARGNFHQYQHNVYNSSVLMGITVRYCSTFSSRSFSATRIRISCSKTGLDALFEEPECGRTSYSE